MGEFYEYLHSLHINESPDVFEIIPKLPFEKIIEIAIQCYTLTETKARPTKDLSVFDFSASSSISGGIYPCSEIDCRLKNVYELAAFSALYADKVLIPNPFEHIYHHLTSDFNFANQEQLYIFCNRLMGDIVIMLNLRPLVDGGILYINPQLGSFCKECWTRNLKEQKALIDEFHKLETRIVTDLNKNIKFVLDTNKTIVAQGTPNYLGSEVFRFVVLPKVLKAFRKSIPHTFSPTEVETLRLWEPFVTPVIEDLILQKFSMIDLNTAYLTNRGIEADIINNLEENAERSKEKAIIDGMAHKLPFIENATLSSLVKVRQHEAESFAVYRDVVKNTIQETKDETNAAIIKSIVEDKINPELHKLDQIIKNHKDDFQKQGRKDLFFNSLLLITGFFSNSNSALIEGTSALLKDLLKDYSDAKQVPTRVKNSDYYFLWKLEKQVSL